MLLRLFRFLSMFPLSLLHKLGAAAGWLVYLLSPTYRRRFARASRVASFDSSFIPKTK